MSKDARQKLRDMGGIMASSPDLIQAVQKFQMGGGVSAGPSPLRVIPSVRQPSMPDIGPRNPGYDPKLMRSGTVDPVLSGTRRIAPVSPDQARKNAILERAAGRSPTYGSGAQPFSSTPDMPFEPRVPVGPEAGLSERAIDRILADLKAGEISSLEQEEITIDDLLDISLARDIPVEELVAMMPDASKEIDRGEGWVMPGGTAAGETPQWLQDAVRKSLGRTGIGGYGEEPAEDMVTPMGGPRRGAAGPTRSVIDRNVDSLEGPEATGLGGQKMGPFGEIVNPEDVPSDDQRAAATRAALPDIANIEDDTAPAPDETLPPAITDDPEGTATEALSSLDKSYEEKLALFQKVFGDGDEDKSRDRAMSLAMIGLAIAAGQSPNALTNIAQGAMVGLNAMGEQRKERQAKKEKVKVMALDAALKEAAAQQNFERELGLKALDTSNYTEKTKDIETPLGKITVMLPTAEAAARGVEPQLLTTKDLDRQFKTKIEEKNRFMGMAKEAIDILDKPGDTVAGIGGATLRMMQSLNNAGFIPDAFYQRITGLSEGEVSDATKFDVIMTNMAAQLAPMLLGESGRTISDGDRARVADQLGVSYDPASVNDGVPGLTITGFSNVAVKGESGLRERLTRIQGLLDSSYQPVFDTYKQYNPSGYNDYMESLEEAQSGPARVTYDETGKRVQ